MSSLYILGVNVSHDSSCALIKDGQLVCAIAEERLDRIKHTSGGVDEDGMVNKHLPRRSIKYCLDTIGIEIQEVDLIVVSTCVVVNVHDYSTRRLTKEEIIEQLPDSVDPDRVEIVDHHLGHAASAFYPSPFQEAAVLVADGGGSLVYRDGKGDHEKGWYEQRVSIYHGQNDDLKVIDQYFDGLPSNGYLANDQHCSLGDFYQSATGFIGFSYGNEGKTMGLAALGSHALFSHFDQAISFKDNNLQINSDFQFNKHLNTMRFYSGIVVPKRGHGQSLRTIDQDIAAAVQHSLEEVLVKLANQAFEKSGSANLCMAGGIALNSVANKVIFDRTPFENIFIQPASGDDGCAIGNAFFGLRKLNHSSRGYEMKNAYTGRSYSENELKNAIKQYEGWIRFSKEKDLLHQVCSFLVSKKIVGWFQGGSEFGPRALGHRSILCDPRQPEMKDILNKKVKHREPFRPFAPSVLLEHLSDYFDLTCPSPYMLLVAKIKKPNVIPAVTHDDGTGRIQTVTKEDNGIYYDLIKTFYEETGVPIILNTSFNDNNEPIVETPQDALKCFLKTNIDYLVMGDWVVEKRVWKWRLFFVLPPKLVWLFIRPLYNIIITFPFLGKVARTMKTQLIQPSKRINIKIPG